MADIFDSLDEMIALCTRKIELMHQLKRALRIAELLGVPPKDLKGPVGFRVYEGHTMFRPWTSATVAVTVGEERHEFPLIKVHKDLWPADVLQAYEREQKRVARAKERTET